MQQLPVTKITPFYMRCSCFSSCPFKLCFGTFSAVPWREPISLHRHLSFCAFSPRFCELSGKSASAWAGSRGTHKGDCGEHSGRRSQPCCWALPWLVGAVTRLPGAPGTTGHQVPQARAAAGWGAHGTEPAGCPPPTQPLGSPLHSSSLRLPQLGFAGKGTGPEKPAPGVPRVAEPGEFVSQPDSDGIRNNSQL